VKPSEWSEPERRLGVQLSVPPLLGDLGRRVAETIGVEDHRWHAQDAWSGGDELSARWSLTVVPSIPEPAFAAALVAGVKFVDHPIAYQRPDIVLEHAQAPGVRLPDVGWRAIAVGLLAKSPDLQRSATDVVVHSIADGRFDPDLLGRSLAWLLGEGVGTSARVGGPLHDVARTSPLHAAQVVRAVGALVAELSAAPHALHVPLETALEHAISVGAAIESAPARAGLERLAAATTRGSKLGKAAAGLLELRADESRLGPIRAEAATVAAT
jgi:hypothetical protein